MKGPLVDLPPPPPPRGRAAAARRRSFRDGLVLAMMIILQLSPFIVPLVFLGLSDVDEKKGAKVLTAHVGKDAGLAWAGVHRTPGDAEISGFPGPHTSDVLSPCVQVPKQHHHILSGLVRKNLSRRHLRRRGEVPSTDTHGTPPLHEVGEDDTASNADVADESSGAGEAEGAVDDVDGGGVEAGEHLSELREADHSENTSAEAAVKAVLDADAQQASSGGTSRQEGSHERDEGGEVAQAAEEAAADGVGVAETDGRAEAGEARGEAAEAGDGRQKSIRSGMDHQGEENERMEEEDEKPREVDSETDRSPPLALSPRRSPSPPALHPPPAVQASEGDAASEGVEPGAAGGEQRAQPLADGERVGGERSASRAAAGGPPEAHQ